MALKNLKLVLDELRKENPKGFSRAVFLDALRHTLRRARGELLQSTVAERSTREQSEISRLENGVTNFTRIGSILDYIAACEANIVIAVYDSKGDIISTVSTIDEAVEHESLIFEAGEQKRSGKAQTFAGGSG